MKKLLTAAAALAAVSALSVSAFADANVYVTISDADGNLAVAHKSVSVSDSDGDGALTINDALYAAHEEFYNGGAAAGYGSDTGDYGLMITKLWGSENGGSYGYYVNNASAMSLADPVADGDHLNAFVYTDLTGWSDTYCYFNEDEVSTEDGSVTLTLSAASFDENWAPVTVPVEGASITVDGKETGAVTGADGTVTFTVDKDGDYVISAKSSTQTLVPPVCLLNVKLAAAAQTETSAPAAGDVSAETDSTKAGSPDTGIGDVAAVAGIAFIGLCGLVAARRK